MKRPPISATRAKKIKVTKLIPRKIPWYERKALLFAVLACALAVGGILMAQIYRRSSGTQAQLGATAAPGAAGSGAADGSASATGAASAPAAPPAAVETPHVMSLGMALPPVGPDEVLAPVEAETLSEAARVRGAFREARAVRPVGPEDRGLSPGTCAFVDAGALVAAVGSGTPSAGALESLPLVHEQRPWADFEIHRDAQGHVYLVGFVEAQVAEHIGVLGAQLPLAPPDPQPRPPRWQFWRRRAAAPLVLRRGSVIALYPDLDPDATCAVVLPLARIAGLAQRTGPGGARRVQALNVTLR